ncbi:UV DNA damage repair endonuclease UvsE [Conexibacter sp. SYSU D00693]|uniref:UV DNA damage repair endonuclease UvsE n=1 Tax=Conexibacter sp. SYSU D00693 TaxID=2812560 RepID=UPI00196AB7B7|nr:UV DNA damage repair endonuclease UvsE [Conexibacter sp. SYSU D00693]
MRLGFAVKVLGAGGLPSHDTRRWQSEPSLGVSLDHLEAILGYLDDTDIRFYRMATGLAPYASHPELTQFRDQPARFADRLAEVGARARELGIRLTTHPGQYTVLNSEDAEVQRLAAVELEVQAELMDAMGLGPESIVVLHVGGAAGGPAAAMDRFCQGFELLSDAARSRLVIENDDRTFSLRDVLALSERVGRPVVWDILHHHCNDPDRIPDREALELALATWPAGVLPKIHYSTPKTAVEEQKVKKGRRVERRVVLPQLRAHADTIDPIAFEQFLTETAEGLDFDVMLEAKAKDLALLRLREQLAARGVAAREGHLQPAG